jgi:parallel beta-helix repeat protein
MKINKRQLVLLLLLGLAFPLIANNNSTLKSENITYSISPKTSAGYVLPFIHVDGSIANNWSDTLAEPWCSFVNGRYVIENVTIDATGSQKDYGILVNNSINERFMIRNCTIINAHHSFFASGIRLENTHNGTIIGNNCTDNYQGIYVKNSIGINITGNIANNNQINGIYLDTNCHDNNITGNSVNSNLIGIQLTNNCDNNNITLNIVTKSESDQYGGIFINSFPSTCDNNIVLNNLATENHRHGIYIRYNNNNNHVINNTVSENDDSGICLETCHYINVHGNLVLHNSRGIILQNCDNGNITHNIITNNNQIGIYVYYNSDDNLIKNNTINQNGLGIALEQSDLNNITGNSLIGNGRCLLEINSIGNIIIFNNCSTPTLDLPIFIDGTATGVGAHNWTWAQQQSWFGGGSGTKEAPYVIENLSISGFGLYNLNGIEVQNSNVYFIIRGCKIFNSRAGISLSNVNHSLLIENNCSHNIYNGIYLEEGSCYNNITENTCYDSNTGIGMYLNSSYNRILNNIIIYNDEGINLESDCNHSIILGNIINHNAGIGIRLSQSGQNAIIGNNASINDNNGIYLEDECDYNVILNNNFDNNNLGIELYYSDLNSINNNTVFNNSYSGIELEASNFNNIVENIAANNTEFGIYIESDSNNNSIYKNIFLINGIHACDDGTNNKWNSSVIGNYWDNHTGPDISPPDGIVDNPYTFIGGSSGSIDFLPIAVDSLLEITINSPKDNDLFGVSSPSFDLTIIDNYFIRIWYTLDDGMNNYTITENGKINQSAWSAHPDGTITVRFYAIDLIGHLKSAEVEIEKDTTSPNITINSPSPGSEYGTTAPIFDINITDVHLDSMWYSLDGGFTTYIITSNGTIDQIAWTALSEGTITITFYANDTAGNTSLKEVVISKSIPPVGPDPIMIIIIVVSIIGGVAVIVVILVVLNRQGKISLEKLKSPFKKD